MTSFRSQHRHTLRAGVVVERLPLGFAAGRWWATFVSAVPGWTGREPPVDWRTLTGAAYVDDPDGRLDCVGGGGGGSERGYQHTWELVDHGASQARVSYVDDDVEVGSELLALDPSDRAGCFAVRLGDGSLVERLPVGHAHGAWRVRWVRSDVPPDELDLEDQDDAPAGTPHERFVRLRSPAGPIGRVDGWGVIGGAVQPFGVDVPDTHRQVEVDYLVEGDVVGTEVLPLPGLAGREPDDSRGG